MRKRLGDAWYAFTDFLRSHLVEFYIIIAIVAFILVLFPTRVLVTIPPGSVGVLWERFGGGTDFCNALPEGTRFKFPWDEVAVFSTRLQEHTDNISVLSNNGLEVKMQVVVRYQLVKSTIPALFEYAGLGYDDVLVEPEVNAVTRNVISRKLPQDIYADRPAIQDQIKRLVNWNLYASFNPTNIPRTTRTPIPGEWAEIALPPRPTASDFANTPSRFPTSPNLQPLPGKTSNPIFSNRDLAFPMYIPADPVSIAASPPPSNVNYLPCPSRGPIASFVWVQVENIFITDTVFPTSLQQAITETNQQQQLYFSYYWRQRQAQAEAIRLRTEATGVRDASVIMSQGLTNNYLRYVGIQATQSLAQSSNAKIIVIGGNRDGLPLVLGADSGSTETSRTSNSGTGALAGPLSPQQFLEHQLAQ